jgi:hypothetical protein
VRHYRCPRHEQHQRQGSRGGWWTRNGELLRLHRLSAMLLDDLASGIPLITRDAVQGQEAVALLPSA